MVGSEMGMARTVADLMRKDVVTVIPDATVRELARLLRENGISGAPVAGTDGRVIGLVSSRDILWIADRRDERERDMPLPEWDGFDRIRVRDLMTPDVFGVPIDTNLEGLRGFFIRTGVHRAPVIAGDRVIGMVTLTDHLGTIARTGSVAGP